MPERPSQRKPPTYRERAISLTARVAELEQENARLTGLSQQWMKYHSQAALVIARVQKTIAEHPAAGLASAIGRILGATPAIDGRTELRTQIIDELAQAWADASAKGTVTANQANVHNWLINQK